MNSLNMTLTLTVLAILSALAFADTVAIIPVTESTSYKTSATVAIIPVTDEPSYVPNTALTTSHSTSMIGSDGLPLTRDSSLSSSSTSVSLRNSTGTSTYTSTPASSSTSSAAASSTKTSAGNRNDVLGGRMIGTVAAGVVVFWVAVRVFAAACVGAPVARLGMGNGLRRL
ncbi:uncharacterized protein PAC_18600 [Phialocephala subalpina]|uniref:Uncharacterized protein n=1 Tax=Phialocephala subalpina TaxID=576137 RepID=A0A1L7XUK7_9HELO|nr:uncharacterized protein PAC_18600 [Phialocephala subalpina]